MQPDHRIRRGCHIERDEMREWLFDGVSSVPVVVSRSVIDKHARGIDREDLYFWKAGTIHFSSGGSGGDGFRIHGGASFSIGGVGLALLGNFVRAREKSSGDYFNGGGLEQVIGSGTCAFAERFIGPKLYRKVYYVGKADHE
eukprot:Gb_37663 [translate_table: standard]